MVRISGGRERYRNGCAGVVGGLVGGHGLSSGYFPLRRGFIILGSEAFDMVWSWSTFVFDEGRYVRYLRHIE